MSNGTISQGRGHLGSEVQQGLSPEVQQHLDYFDLAVGDSPMKACPARRLLEHFSSEANSATCHFYPTHTNNKDLNSKHHAMFVLTSIHQKCLQ